MKKISFLLAVFLFWAGLSAEQVGSMRCNEFPKETAVLKLSNEADWKEISRYVVSEEGFVENIPVNHTRQNWTRLICVQHIGFSETDEKLLDVLLETLRNQIISSYPSGKVTWNIIEKNENTVLYEWILHQGYKNIPPQHEIVRGFVTSTGFHRVGYTVRNQKMNEKEREKWVQILKEKTVVVPLEESVKLAGLSLGDKMRDSLLFGPHFADWKTFDSNTASIGWTQTTIVPPSVEKETDITEYLDVLIAPGLNEVSIDQMFQTEMQGVRKRAEQTKVAMKVLHKTPREMIYAYTYGIGNGVHISAVVRSFLTKYGYYSISYKQGLPRRMMQEEITVCRKKLEEILVRTKS